MNLIDVVKKHREAKAEPGPEGVNSFNSFNSYIREPEFPSKGSDNFGQCGNREGVSSLNSFSSYSSERCFEWCQRFIRGRYPRLAAVIEAARNAGFDAGIVIATLEGDRFVQYEAFGSDTIKIRTVNDFPDDPCIRAWCRMDLDELAPEYHPRRLL